MQSRATRFADSLRGQEKTKQRQALLDRLRAVGRPFRIGSIPTKQESAAVLLRMRNAGIREFPYPYSSAFSVTSDTDSSSRSRYDAYMSELVYDHGLDFGDSVWLHAAVGSRPGAGYLSRNFTLYDRDEDQRLRHQRGLNELLQETADGNIDHWHAFLVRGPRIIQATRIESGVDKQKQSAGPTKVIARLPSDLAPQNARFVPVPFPVYAISIFLKDGSAANIVSVVPVLEEKAAANERQLLRKFRVETDARLYPMLETKSQEKICFFVLDHELTSSREAVSIQSIETLEIEVEGGDANDISKILLHNIHSELVLDRLEYLSRKGRVGHSLLTTHAEWHFIGAQQEKINQAVMQRRRTYPNAIESYYGDFSNSDEAFSTLADNRLSFCRLFPEIIEQHNILFYRIIGTDYPRSHSSDGERVPAYDALPDEHCRLPRLVYPVVNRMGNGVYYVRTTMASLPSEEERPELVRNVGHRTFHLRVRQVYQDLAKHPFQAAILYTHLGDISPETESPRPYFPSGTLSGPRDKHYGIRDDSRSLSTVNRVWFTRASDLCNYAALAVELPEVLERSSDDKLIIHSWHDPFWSATVPQHPAQLFGQTFFVADARRARVFVGSHEVRDLIRNVSPTDEPPSVMIASCGIHFPVFAYLDPADRGDNLLSFEGARWHWAEREGMDGDCGCGTITLAEARAQIEVRTPGLTPAASQIFSFDVRSIDAISGLVIIVVSESGAKFVFANDQAPDAFRKEFEEEATGVFHWSAGATDEDGWCRAVVPLFNVRWVRTFAEHEIVPLPNHAVRKIEFHLLGRNGAELQISRVCFGRPRTSLSRFSPGSIVLGGTASPHAAVNISSRYPSFDATTIEIRADHRGTFLSDPLPRGAYRCRDIGSGKELVVDAMRDHFLLDLRQ